MPLEAFRAGRLPVFDSYSQNLYSGSLTDWDRVHMAVEQYFILQDNNEWKISFSDKLYGPYDTQQDAIEAAIDAAYAMGNIGIDVQVLVRDADQKLRIAWSYGQDVYN